MEIIKEIKAAEKDAKQMLEDARVKAAAILEDAKARRAAEIEKHRLQRRQIIDMAVKQASEQAQGEVATLENESSQICDEINGKSAAAISGAVDTVINFISNLSEK